MTVKLVEDWATTQVRRDIRDSLQSVGEPAILLALRHPGADADAARCDCHDDVYNDGETGCHECFAPGTLIRTETGFRPIETIKAGDRVLTAEGTYQAVTKTFVRDYSGVAYQWRTSAMVTPVISTGNHPIWTMKTHHIHRNKVQQGCAPGICDPYIRNAQRINQPMDVRQSTSGRWVACVSRGGTRTQKCRTYLGTFDTREQAESAVIEWRKQRIDTRHHMAWVDASELNNCSWVGTCVPGEDTDQDFVAPPGDLFNRSGPTPAGPRTFEITNDFLWMVGIYLAEGSAGKRSISFGLHRNEIEYQQRIINIFTGYGYKCKIYTNSGLGVKVEVHSSVLAEWFTAWLGHGCQNKAIPQELMALSPKKARHIVQGIWDGDGSKSDPEVGQTSPILALQLAEIMQRDGDQPTIRYLASRSLTPNGSARKPAYVTSWSTPRQAKQRNRKRRWKFGDEQLARIVHHQEIPYTGKVYNLEVEGSHTYVVQNTLVHNCYGTSFADPIKTAALVWAVFTDMVDAETLSDKGTFTPDQRIVQTEGYPRLMEHDVVVRVRRWNDDLPVEIEGFYGVQQVTVDSVRTGGRFGQYGWDIVGQKATCTRLSTSAPITRYPVLGQTFTAPVLPGKGPLSSPRPRP